MSTQTSDDLFAPPSFAPPSLLMAAAELNGIGRLAFRGLLDDPLGYFTPPKRQEISIPKGTERIVLLLPGFMSPGTSMQWLANYIRSESVHTLTWGSHANIPFSWVVNHCFDLIRDLAETSGTKVDLVGHSLGGFISCHAAHEFPEYVNNVYTLGSPLEELIGATNLDKIARLISNRYIQNIIHKGIFDSWAPESTKESTAGQRTAFVAANDAIVAAFASMLKDTESTRSFILRASHVGLVTDKFVAKSLKLMIHAGTHHVELPDDVRKHLLSSDELNEVLSQSIPRRLTDYFAHTPSGFTPIARAAIEVERRLKCMRGNRPEKINDPIAPIVPIAPTNDPHVMSRSISPLRHTTIASSPM